MLIPSSSKSKADQDAKDALSESSDADSLWSLGLDKPSLYTSSTTSMLPALASTSASAAYKPYGIFPQYTTHDQPVLLRLKRDNLLASRMDVSILRGPGADADTSIFTYTGLPLIGDLKSMFRLRQEITLSDAQGTPLLSLHHTMGSFKGWVAVQPGTFNKKVHAANLGPLAQCTSFPPEEMFHVVRRSMVRFRSALVLPSNLGGEPVECEIRWRPLKLHHKVKNPEGGKFPLVLIKERSGIKTDALVEVAPHFDLALAVALAIISTQQTQEVARASC